MNAYDLVAYINTEYLKDSSRYPVLPKARVILDNPNNEEEVLIYLSVNSDYPHKVKEPCEKMKVGGEPYFLLVFADLSFTINTTKRQITTKIGGHKHIDFYDSSYDNKLASLAKHIFNNVFDGVNLLDSALFYAELEEQEDPDLGNIEVVCIGVSKP